MWTQFVRVSAARWLLLLFTPGFRLLEKLRASLSFVCVTAL